MDFQAQVPKKRHLNDRPVVRGAQGGGDVPKQYSCPPTWDGIEEMVKEQSQRIAVEKKILKAKVAEIIDGGGHHLVDTARMEGLEPAENDERLADQLLGDNIISLGDLADDEE